jgi:hypothetical protein
VALGCAPQSFKGEKVMAKKTSKKVASSSGTRYAARPITVLKREHSADPQSKRGRALKLLLAAKTTSAVVPQLKKIGINTSIIAFAVKHGLIKLGTAAVPPPQKAAQ